MWHRHATAMMLRGDVAAGFIAEFLLGLYVEHELAAVFELDESFFNYG